MTERQLARRVEFWQQRLAPLGIGHFRISGVHIVQRPPGSVHAEASVQVPDHYDNAEFWFREDYVEECDAEDLDQTIIHEWLHVAMRDFDQALEAVDSWMPEQTYNDFEEAVNHEREGLIERLTRVIWAFHDGY